MNVPDLLAGCQFLALRYEGPHVECTGITAVAKRELRVFHHRGGVMILPWSGRLASARAARDKGLILDTGISYSVPVSAERAVQTRVLAGNAPGQAPALYLAADGFFDGNESPYDTPRLNRDALFFGLAVKQLVAGRIPSRAWVWAADWQTVPAAALLHPQHVTALTLHNTFDSYLGDTLWQFDELRYDLFRDQTALEAALDWCDVVTTVNRGYAYGLRSEVFHTKIMAPHLQAKAHRIIGIDNANFVDPSPAQLELAELIEQDSEAGLNRLEEMQRQAVESLPSELAERVRGKVLCVTMGRRSSQKLHDLVAAAVRNSLAADPELPLFVFFATTHSDGGSAARLERIKRLCDEHPEHAGWSDGRIPYYSQLMEAGSYNILCSLWEPHGGAFEATIVPIARAVDGLAAQIVPPHRHGRAGELANRWHAPTALPNGLTFREDPPETYAEDLRELLERSPTPPNATSRRMALALAATLRQAIDIRLHRPADYARMVLGALRQQEQRSWLINLGGLMALVEAAHSRRLRPVLRPSTP